MHADHRVSSGVHRSGWSQASTGNDRPQEQPRPLPCSRGTWCPLRYRSAQRHSVPGCFSFEGHGFNPGCEQALVGGVLECIVCGAARRCDARAFLLRHQLPYWISFARGQGCCWTVHIPANIITRIELHETGIVRTNTRICYWDTGGGRGFTLIRQGGAAISLWTVST